MWRCINLDSSLQSKGSFEGTPGVNPEGEVTQSQEKGRRKSHSLFSVHTGMSAISKDKSTIYPLPLIFLVCSSGWILRVMGGRPSSATVFHLCWWLMWHEGDCHPRSWTVQSEALAEGLLHFYVNDFTFSTHSSCSSGHFRGQCCI